MLLVSLILIFGKLNAQVDSDSVRWNKELPAVQIVANRPQEVIPPQLLSGPQLKKMATYSVADAIRYFSGVQIKDYGGLGGLKTVNIRSMGTNHMGVFYDGIQLGNAQNGQIDLGKFSLDNIESISLYNGQKSNIFQSAKDFGSAGTIYLQTKRPSFKERERTNLRATIKGGSFMMIAPSILWEQKINNNLAFNVSTEFLSSDGKYPFRYKRVFEDHTIAYDTTAYRKNGDITAIRVESSLFGKLRRGQWDLHGYYYWSHRGLPGPIVKNVFEHGQRLYDENFFVQAKFENEWTDRFATKINTKYANDYTRYIDREWTSPLYVDNKYEQHDFYISIANRYKIFPNWQVNLSTDFQYNSLFANLVNFSYPERYSVLIALASEFSWRRLTIQGSLLGTIVREKVRQNAAAPAKNILSPALILSYQPWRQHNLSFNAFYKNSFRMPTFNDLYYTFIGNSVLKPEYVEMYNIGLFYSKSAEGGFLRHFQFSTDVYYNHIRDKIVAVPAGNMFRWMMLNLGEVDIKGLESSVLATISPIRDLYGTLRINYTYQRALDVTDVRDKNYRHQIVYIPRHSGSLLLGLEYKNWGLNYSFIYTGERYNAKYNDKNSHMQPWYTSDITVRKSFEWRGGRYRLDTSFDINNLLNQHYDVVLNYPMPGRNYRLTTTFTLGL